MAAMTAARPVLQLLHGFVEFADPLPGAFRSERRRRRGRRAVAGPPGCRRAVVERSRPVRRVAA
ncbi:hypothetical protein ABZ826_01695 [Streptomyces sp. NPDC047515]|uniref:hypothetical protein n=1 Tax=Streptomyces sp. NPDC047515 TaxID=3155380 RepID=UPI0033C361BA